MDEPARLTGESSLWQADMMLNSLRAPLRRLQPDVVIPFLLVVGIWGSTWLVIRHQLGVVPPGWSIAYRFYLASFLMFALAAFRGERIMIGWRAVLLSGLVGLCQFALNFNFVYQAEAHVTSGLVAVIFALLLIPNSLFARLIFGTRLHASFVMGSMIAVCGVALLFVHEYRQMGPHSGSIVSGIGLALAGVLCASTANLLQSSRFASEQPILSVLAWAMLIGALCDTVWALAVAGPPTFDPRPAYVAGVVYLAVAGSVITFPIYFALLRRVGPGPAAYTSVLIPILAMVLSTLFEGYRWSVPAGLGVLLALTGMAVALRSRLTSADSPSR